MAFTRIDSHIDSVCVFQRDALVTRKGVLNVDSGKISERIKIDNLPLCLTDATLTAEIDGDISFRESPFVTDLRVGLEVPVSTDTDLPVTPEVLEKIYEEERRYKQQIECLNKELEKLKKLSVMQRQKPEESSPPDTPTDARMALAEFKRRQREELLEERRNIQKLHWKTVKKRKDLEEQNRQSSDARQAEEHELRKTVYISLYAPKTISAESLTVKIHYKVPGARWVPGYTLLLNKTDDFGEILMRAQVIQATGEDWTDVKLSLSTANPLGWSELPELTSKRIGKYQPPLESHWTPPPPGTDELFADFERFYGQPTEAKDYILPPLEDEAMLGEAPQDILDPEDTTVDTLKEESMKLRDVDDTVLLAKSAAPMKMATKSRSGFSPFKALKDTASALFDDSLEKTVKSGRPAAACVGAPDMAEASMVAGESMPPSAPPRYVEPAVEITEFMNYGSLRMPPPDDVVRGKLQVVDEFYMYSEMIVRQQISIHHISALVQAATDVARDAGTTAPPKRYQYPEKTCGFDYIFTTSTPVDVPSDFTFHSIPVNGETADVESLYVSVPREVQHVFKTVKIKNPFAAPLLPGPVDIYIGKEFLMTSDLYLTPSGGIISIGMGVEDAIKVSRNTHFKEESSGIVHGVNSLQHEVSIKLVNNLSKPVKVEVRERIPVAKNPDDKEIEVVIDHVEPNWHKYEQEKPKIKGGYCWEIEIEPGEKKTLNMKYTIKIPARDELFNGNRRES